MIGSFILSHDSKLTGFGQRIETKLSHGPGTSTENVKITNRVQVDSLCCPLLYSQILKERTVKWSKIVDESSRSFEFRSLRFSKRLIRG